MIVSGKLIMTLKTLSLIGQAVEYQEPKAKHIFGEITMAQIKIVPTMVTATTTAPILTTMGPIMMPPGAEAAVEPPSPISSTPPQGQ